MAQSSSSRILVVDDEEIVVRSLTALLEMETDHTVIGHTSALAAAELVKTQPPDLVISDFLMPDMDGVEFLLEVRRLYPESCLMLLTGYADKQNAIRAINEVGIFHYMEKPWDNDDLLEIVESGLDRRLQLHRLHERVRELEAKLRMVEGRYSELEGRLREG